MPTTPDVKAEIQPAVGGLDTMMDFLSAQAGASSIVQSTYVMPEAMHLHGTFASWNDMQYGDRAFMNVQPQGLDASPAQSASIGATTINLPTGMGANYQAAGIKIIEFWNAAETQLKEIRKITSISGDVVTLATALTHSIGTTDILKPVIQSYCPIRGVDGLDGGVSFLGDGKIAIDNINQISELIPAGLKLCLRLLTVAGIFNRQIVLNFKFRVPAAA